MKPPLILVTPSIAQQGVEMRDQSLSLSELYLRALMVAGALPLVMPCTTSQELIAECVCRCDGVVLTGGEDVNPELYDARPTPALMKTVVREVLSRDMRELALIDEVFRQHKPLLAICRGHQILNVALGGTLLLDIPTQRRGALPHRRRDRKRDPVHAVKLQPGSTLARLTGTTILGVNSTHHQAVDRVADALDPVGVSSDGIVEALELRPDAARTLPFLVSVQFHPERMADRYPEHARLFQGFVAACVAARERSGRR